MGWFIGSGLRLRRRVVRENLGAAFSLPPRETAQLTQRIYAHLGRVLLETLRLPLLNQDKAREIIGEEALTRLMALRRPERGVLVLTGHLGNWDLLACAAAKVGLPITVVTRSIHQRSMNRWWMRVREACGVRFVPARGSAMKILRALRRGDLVCLALDQHEPGGVVVPFLGRPAATSTGLARLASATGAPVVAAFLVADPEYRVVLEAPLAPPASKDEQDIVVATARYTRAIEEFVRRYPEQWFWVHRRWKVAQNSPLNL